MKKYELLLVLPGTLDETEAQTRSNEILSFVKENSQQAEISTMGKMRLAYPIKQIRYGYFYTIVFNAEVTGLKTLQNKLGLMRDLLRAMFTDFNVAYSPAHKATYGAPTVDFALAEEPTKPDHSAIIKTEKPVAVEKPVEKVDMQAIDKKLDEILSGNIIAGV
ncbi:MAG: 30S ribosomal protein S6 [Candidatus Magasanikbacteria bacterium]|nr:30S ribosomal protein S6 [Candidatus Magasanikbacteria bacterium]